MRTLIKVVKVMIQFFDGKSLILNGRVEEWCHSNIETVTGNINWEYQFYGRIKSD